jgi:hypothetical protein
LFGYFTTLKDTKIRKQANRKKETKNELRKETNEEKQGNKEKQIKQTKNKGKNKQKCNVASNKVWWDNFK